MRKILNYFLIFIIIIIIFNLLLFFSSLFPSNLIKKNVKESAKTLLNEGGDYTLINSFDGLRMNDNYTDALMINEAYSIDNHHPFNSYMMVRRNYKTGLTKNTFSDTIGELKTGLEHKEIAQETDNTITELVDFMDNKVTTSISYARYWHGYLPFLRVMLLFFNISEIRVVLLGILILLAFFLTYLIKEKIGKTIAIIFIFSLIVQDYFIVGYSLECSSVFLVMMLSCIILLKYFNKINIYKYLFITACITNFVDYLTVPLITLGVPLCLYLLLKERNNESLKYKKTIKLIIKASAIWGLGYGLTWLSKWIIYSIFFQENLLKSAFMQVLYRSSRKNIYVVNKGDSSKILSLHLVLAYFFFKNLLYIFIYILVFEIIHKKYAIKIKSTPMIFKIISPYLLISSLPFLWYIALANHTIMHKHFVCRHMIIFLFSLLICFNKLIILRPKPKN